MVIFRTGKYGALHVKHVVVAQDVMIIYQWYNLVVNWQFPCGIGIRGVLNLSSATLVGFLAIEAGLINQ